MSEKVVEIKGLYKSFGDQEVLKNLSLDLYKGENLVVLGKSGTGKSVLIKCLVGLIIPDAGELNILGTHIEHADEDAMTEVRKKVGFLFQSAALYDSMSVRENLEFPLKRIEKNISKADINTRVSEALENVGLLDSIDKMPSQLSGGMRKRVGLARTIVLNPQIILYDEPTTGLDSITSREISDLILSLQQKFNTSSIIITHDMPCAKHTANRIIILADGKEIGEGTYDALQNSSDTIINSFFKH